MSKRQKTKMVVPGLGDRLGEIIDAKYDGTPYQLAKALGDVDRFKNRVGYWRDGLEGMSTRHLQLVCETTGASAHYLLCGDGPMWAADIRSSVDVGEPPLAERLEAYVRREAIAAAGSVTEPWLRELLPELIDGSALLQRLVDMVATDLRANVAWFRERAATAKAAAKLPASALKDIQRFLVATKPPGGQAIVWSPVTFTRPATEDAPQHKKRTTTTPKTRKKAIRRKP